MSKSVVINQIPSPTWSWLKMDNASLDVESELITVEPKISHIQNCVRDDSLSIDNLSVKFTSGIGKEADNFFKDNKSIGLIIPVNTKTEEPIVLAYDLSSKKSTLTSQKIIAEKNSEATIIILSENSNDSEVFQVLKTQIVAKEGAVLNLFKVQLLSDKSIQIDESSTYTFENANVNVKHIVLGGAKTFVGVGTELREYKSSFTSDMAYLCQNNQELDLNYIVNHYGKKTSCSMFVNGTLRDKAKKTYRGTIDFKLGCSGSEGEEQEETLLLSPEVVNNSIPVILCDEEDVAGEHGASIGRLSDEMLFYMQSRGIEKTEAENAIARSKIQRIVSLIKNEEVVSTIEKYMLGVFGDI